MLERDDRILVSTRIVAAAVIPFLLLAFAILYFFPETSAQRFAWEVQSKLTAAYIGAGYVGGAYLFVHALLGRRWHRVAVGFPAVAVFTVSMLLGTVLHWSQFDLGHFPFQLWLGLYIITPVLVPWVWLRNGRKDSLTPEPGDKVVPRPVRLAVGVLGAGLLLISVAGFSAPALLVQAWPWTLSLLTGRLLAGWGALIGVANLMVAGEARWSGWRVGIVAIALWHVLFLISAAINAQEFNGGRWLNWYTLSVAGILAFMGGLYAYMETRRAEGNP